MDQKQLLNQIITYGVKNKKNKEDIFNALLQSGQFDVATAATSLKQIGDLGVFDYQGTDGTNPGGPQVASSVAQELGDSKAAKEMISSLESGIQSEGGKKAYSPGIGQLRSYNPWDTDVQTIQSQINATKQIVGKYLEGGVLRLEDEKKYEKILPKIGDTPDVAKAKIEQVKKLIEEKYNAQTETLGQAGFDTSGFKEQTDQPVPGFQEALDFARQNPNDPKSQQLIQAVRSGQIDPITGQKKTVNPELPMTDQQPAQQPVQQEQGKAGILSRTWGATKEVVPGLIGDVGKRIKNIAGNSLESANLLQSKDISVFEGVLKGFETNFRNLGEVGGAVGDVASRALEFAYKAGVPKEAQDKIKQTATEFIQTERGQQAISALQGGIEVWNKFKESNPNVAKDMEAAFNIVTAIPSAKGLGVAGKGLGEAKAVASDLTEIGIRATGKTGVEDASKSIFKAVKPSITVDRNKKFIRETLDSANEEIVKRGYKPTNLKEYADQLSETRKKVWSDIESKIGAGEGTKIDLQPISDEIKKMASSSELVRTSKSTADRISQMADTLISQGKQISVQDAEKLKQFINAELKGTFGKFNLSSAEQNAKKLITQKIGEQLDGVLSKVPGEFSGLKNKYGALRQTEEDVLKRLVVFERQNPQGLVDSFSKVSGIGKIIKAFVPGGGGVSSFAQGAGELALGQIQKRANNADVLVKNAFEKLSKRMGKFEPRSKLLKGEYNAGLSMKVVDDPKLLQMDDTLMTLEKQFDSAIDSRAKKNIKKSIDDLIKRRRARAKDLGL